MHDQMLSYDKILHQEDNRSNVDKKKSDKNVSSRKKSDQNIFLVRAERFTYGLRSSPTFIKKRLSKSFFGNDKLNQYFINVIYI